jgi:hypothetical protein
MLVLAAASVRSPIAWVAAAINVLAILPAVATFDDFHGERFQGNRREVIEQFARDVRASVRFDRAVSPWGNSVLVHVDRYQYPLLGMPRGMGVGSVLSWGRIGVPPRSRYLVLAPGDFEQLPGRARLTRLGTTVLGDLYENPDWSR